MILAYHDATADQDKVTITVLDPEYADQQQASITYTLSGYIMAQAETNSPPTPGRELRTSSTTWPTTCVPTKRPAARDSSR